MASHARLAKLLAHIEACHSAVLPGARLQFCIGDTQVGYVTPDFATILRRLDQDITVLDRRLVLAPAAAGRLNEIALAAGQAWRGEMFDVRAAVDGPVLAKLDRGALPAFGVVGVGVHLNGLVRRADGWHLWVARRAADKKLDPGKFDHLVAGGVPAGLSRMQTLVKEASEEADLPAGLVQQARQVARLDYAMERPEGLRRDVVFAYDLELPESFSPHPNDDEVESFALWPLAQVLDRVSTSDDFKFNVTLVLIDLFIRFGLLDGADAERLRAALSPR